MPRSGDAENAFGIDWAAWRPAYAVLGGDPLPWAEIASRMKPPELERERRACLTDQYGGLYGEVAGIVGEEGVSDSADAVWAHSHSLARHARARADT